MDEPKLPEPIEFEWDSGNKIKNQLKHGIINRETEEPFFRHKLIVPDQRHSAAEQRFGMYGQTNEGKTLFIAFTIRDRRVRIISARPADKKERKIYEESIKKTA